MKKFKGKYGFRTILGFPLYFRRFKNQEQARVWAKENNTWL